MGIPENEAPTPVALSAIDRPSVRSLVETEAVELLAIAKSGGDVHQVALDRQDEIQKFAATLSDEDSVKFWGLYNQELMASSQAANQALEKTQMQNIQTAGNISTWISIAVFFAILVVAIKLFRG